MRFTKFYLLLALCLCSNQAIALFQGGFDYKIITGNLKPTPGCKKKEKATKQASTGYRFNKYSKVLCQQIGYGWGLSEVKDRGEVVCEECDGKAQNGDGYQCYVKNITLKCGLTRRGW